MAQTLLQFDFPFAGPWGDEMAGALGGLAQDIATEPGLIWKIWTENRDEGRAGGLYLFDNPVDAARYKAKHTDRLAAFGVTGIVAHVFAVNPGLNAITRAPI